jgi:hypothetical protein
VSSRQAVAHELRGAGFVACCFSARASANLPFAVIGCWVRKSK